MEASQEFNPARLSAAAEALRRASGIDVRPAAAAERAGELSPSERDFAERRMPPVTAEEMCRRLAGHLVKLTGHLELPKIAYRRDAVQITNDVQAAIIDVEQTFGMGEFRGRGVVQS